MVATLSFAATLAILVCGKKYIDRCIDGGDRWESRIDHVLDSSMRQKNQNTSCPQPQLPRCATRTIARHPLVDDGEHDSVKECVMVADPTLCVTRSLKWGAVRRVAKKVLWCCDAQSTDRLNLSTVHVSRVRNKETKSKPSVEATARNINLRLGVSRCSKTLDHSTRNSPRKVDLSVIVSKRPEIGSGAKMMASIVAKKLCSAGVEPRAQQSTEGLATARPNAPHVHFQKIGVLKGELQ
ncbi:hypothetical protein BLNAU_18555 [Blattamonas nauphoetae]|uniref:Secreted protein n=1 Tax=Blattamonas nauphoetae TaxID=2049346 RepID=A0ABQ9X4J6_9EUKA|nr:hypothetical protein BLNAU_18555 [Blattamonas nauphoetae]